MNMLNDDELAGVMAHELSHVKNRDILVMSVASTMASVVAYVTRIAVWSALFNDERNGASLAIALLADITLPIAAALIQLGVSRNREYLADESADSRQSAKLSRAPHPYFPRICTSAACHGVPSPQQDTSWGPRT